MRFREKPEARRHEIKVAFRLHQWHGFYYRTAQYQSKIFTVKARRVTLLLVQEINESNTKMSEPLETRRDGYLRLGIYLEYKVGQLFKSFQYHAAFIRSQH